MTIRYKLTKQDLTTYNGFQWTIGEWKETSGEGELCTSGWLHCYTNPLLAILLNPIHARISNPKLFEIEVDGKCLTDYGLKEGWTKMKLVKEIAIPEITNIQKVAFAILCALEVYHDEKFVEWANNWLNGKDRSRDSANAAAYAANADFSADAAYYASLAAANAAFSADDAYCTAFAANYASYVANYASYVADAADAASTAAASTAIDLIKLAEKAMEYK